MASIGVFGTNVSILSPDGDRTARLGRCQCQSGIWPTSTSSARPQPAGKPSTLLNPPLLQSGTSRRYEQELTGLQRQQTADNLRQRFVSLIRDTIAAGCAASRSNGTPGADPITIWYDLGMDATSPWAYARAMQDRLGAPISQLITGDLGVGIEPISPQR
jgi:hypothetical protein